MRTNARFYLASLVIVLLWTALEIAGVTARWCFRGAALAPRSCPTC